MRPAVIFGHGTPTFAGVPPLGWNGAKETKQQDSPSLHKNQSLAGNHHRQSPLHLPLNHTSGDHVFGCLILAPLAV
jgi:hypothetical protein